MKRLIPSSTRNLALWLGLALTVTGLQSIAAQTFTPAGQRLRALADANNIWIGTSFGDYAFTNNDVDYIGTAAAEYNFMTSEGTMKFKYVEPTQGVFNFTDGDQLVDWAQTVNADIHGHNLLWYYGNPTWLTGGTWTAATLTSVMYNHIDTLLTHWHGEIAAWDVVNEGIDGSKSNADWKQNLRSNDIWNTIIGPTYIELAFQRARQADPAALLIYNDYDEEQLNNKSNTMYNMMVDLKSRGIPVDAVGFQCHWMSQTPNYDSFAQNMDRFAKLGLKIFITEFDNNNPNGSTADVKSVGNDLQARIYYNCMDKCLRNPAFAGFQAWGVTDRYSWLGFANYPLPFDAFWLGYQAKPAYYALQDAMARQFRDEEVTNGGYESGLTGWGNNGNGTLSIVSASPHSGTKAVQMSGRTAQWGGPAQNITSRLTAQGSGRYYMSSWVRFPGGTGTARMTLVLNDATGAHYYTITQALTGTAWTNLAGWVDLTWYKTLTNATLYVETPSTTATFEVDDMRLGDGSLVTNGNLEAGLTGWSGMAGATVSSTTASAQYHYGAKGIACTGRTASAHVPQQDIRAMLEASGPGNYNFQSYQKIATGTGTGKITLRLTYGGTDHYIVAASGAINSMNWTRVVSTAPVSVAWSGALTAAVLYIETPGVLADLYVDEVSMQR